MCNQTYKNFEWIVIDDGSSDNTREIVEAWKNENRIDITYKYQKNNGKHIATNEAIAVAKGEYIVNLDSDDIMRENALERMLEVWNTIPEESKQEYMSVKARCYDPETGIPVGKDIPKGRMVCTCLEAEYKYKIQFQMWSMVRADVLREFPNPNIRGGKNGGGLRFYPEGIWQGLASRKYKTIFINDLLLGYMQNTSTSLMGWGAKYDRYRENIYLWTHVLNNNLDYFFYDPKSFIKASIGVSMDCMFLRKSIKEMLQMGIGKKQKILIALCMPLGWMFYIRRK